MSYLPLDEEGIMDLLTRKEFYQLKADDTIKTDRVDDPLLRNRFKLRGHQLFVSSLMTPNTPYMRLHLMHGTGLGKSLASIAIATEFIRVYKEIYAAKKTVQRSYDALDYDTPMVCILCFGGAKKAFISDLLKYPYFGYISEAEKIEYDEKRMLASTSAGSMQAFKVFHKQLKRRLISKKLGGFFKFYGYEEFVNRLFTSTDINLTDIERQAIDRNVSSEDIFQEYRAAGKIRINEKLVHKFKHSLLICDEIHNTYNTNIKNNRGLAVQYILDNVPSCRFLSLSATPSNNSPTEIIELLNYLIVGDTQNTTHQVSTKLSKKDFFVANKITEDNLERLGRLSQGKISFVRDSDSRYYPERIIAGSPITFPHPVIGFGAGSTLPYLKFISCPMSSLQQQAYEQFIAIDTDTTKETAIETKDDDHNDIYQDIPQDKPLSYHPIPINNYTLFDMVFPGLGNTIVYNSQDIKTKIAESVVIKKSSKGSYSISGSFLKRANIGKYSSKYAGLLDTIDKIIGEAKGDPFRTGKVLIYHDRVRLSGVLLIQELLLANGILNEHYEAVGSTICMICGQTKDQHFDNTKETETRDKQPTHTFIPVRFTIVHGDLDKKQIEDNLNLYDSDSNVHGHKIMILIGSKKIKESYDFKAVKHLIVCSLPTNIPTLIQVFGRCIRTNSHILLPPNQRTVTIYILLTTSGPQATDEVSPELYRYADKIDDYIVIQQIESKLHEYAIDGNILRATIMPDDRPYEPQLGAIYFKPHLDLPTKPTLIYSTFLAYGFATQEVNLIITIIKYCFYKDSVWQYEDLWVEVKNSPISLEVNPSLFSEGNFVIALHYLTETEFNIKGLDMSKLLFNLDKNYYKDGLYWSIKQYDSYYIATPIVEHEVLIKNQFVEYIKDKKQITIDKLASQITVSTTDAENYSRLIPRYRNEPIKLSDFFMSAHEMFNKELARYIKNNNPASFIVDYTIKFQQTYLEGYIANFVASCGASNKASIIDTKHSSAQYDTKLAHDTYHLMQSFGAIILLQEVKKYKEVTKLFANELDPKIDPKTPIGYESTEVIRLYDPSIDRWFNVNKVAINKQFMYKENSIIVGVLAEEDGKIKFKLRSPLHDIKEQVGAKLADKITNQDKTVSKKSAAKRLTNDARLVERGSACQTKPKAEIMQIAANLGISLSKLSKAELKSEHICLLIRSSLIESEIKERQKKSIYKYLYGWWSIEPNIQQYIISR